MKDLTILKENNPALAEILEAWNNTYSRKFNLTDEKEKAIFFEGLVEIAKIVAKQNNSASLSVSFNSQGVSEIICTS